MARGRPPGSKNRPHTDGGSPPSLSNTPSFGLRLASFVDRIESLEADKRAIADDLKEVYAEAKAGGFDTKTLRKLIAERRRDSTLVKLEADLLDTYRRALGVLADTPLGEAAIERLADRPTSPAAQQGHLSTSVSHADAMEAARRHLGIYGRADDSFESDDLPPAA